MTPFEFIARLPHGEAKTAAKAIYKLMMPDWTPIWITLEGSPDRLPPPCLLVVVRTIEGYEFLASRKAATEKYNDWSWSKVFNPFWDTDKQAIVCCEEEWEPQDWIVTHWRPI